MNRRRLLAKDDLAAQPERQEAVVCLSVTGFRQAARWSQTMYLYEKELGDRTRGASTDSTLHCPSQTARGSPRSLNWVDGSPTLGMQQPCVRCLASRKRKTPKDYDLPGILFRKLEMLSLRCQYRLWQQEIRS